MRDPIPGVHDKSQPENSSMRLTVFGERQRQQLRCGGCCLRKRSDEMFKAGCAPRTDVAAWMEGESSRTTGSFNVEILPALPATVNQAQTIVAVRSDPRPPNPCS